jgi:CheY-like chemotaxis protein
MSKRVEPRGEISLEYGLLSPFFMLRKPSLLIVDDEPNVLLTLKLVLEEDGYQISTAGSFAEALQLMRTPGQFDAILTDLWMEREDVGLELARSASKLNPRPIVVIFTGYGSTSNARAALGVPVDYFALKPLDVDELKRVLNRLVMTNLTARRWRS